MSAEDQVARLLDAPPDAEIERMLEALLFAAPEPMTRKALSARLPGGADLDTPLKRLEARYQGRGVELRRIGDAFAFRTAPDLGWALRRGEVVERKLSRAAIETLAAIAYHQPATRAEIEAIRGVAVSKGTLDLLLELGWVRFGRRRESPGRPATFVTTRGFLDQFGLETPRDLPGIREMREAGLISARATHLAEPPRAGEEADLFDGEAPGEA